MWPSHHRIVVYLICQRYKFISKSQPRYHDIAELRGVFDMSKIQIYKQITTTPNDILKMYEVYLICQRYKFISKSQHIAATSESGDGVFDMSKIQIYKQITTVSSYVKVWFEVYLICQRYKFISKSQRLTENKVLVDRCI